MEFIIPRECKITYFLYFRVVFEMTDWVGGSTQNLTCHSKLHCTKTNKMREKNPNEDY